MRPSTTAVIVNYRRYPLVEACVESLLSSSLPPVEIVVVDNATERAQLEQLERRFGDAIKTIANDGNDGYAAACNQGWRSARTELVLFLNADVTLAPETLAACVDEIARDRNAGIVTCRLVRPDGRLDHACHRGTPTPLAALAYKLRLDRLTPRSRRVARYRMAWLDSTGTHDIEVCAGAFMLVRRELLERIGGWNERYWFYGEDVDLCLRAAAAGSRVRFIGSVEAIHAKGASSLLRRPRRMLTARELAHRRRVERAIVDSHQLLFREHMRASTSGIAAALIQALFAAQRLRLAVAGRLDALVLAFGR